MATKSEFGYYRSVDGQSIYDVCMNTYHDLNLVYKLAKDNNFDNLNDYPIAGRLFKFTLALVKDDILSSSELYSTEAPVLVGSFDDSFDDSFD